MSLNRIKIAELTSGVGALVLGLGLGAQFAAHLNGSAILIIAVGAFMHAWGMLDKRTLGTEPKWEKALYWLCWVLLVVLAGYLLLRSG
jgi:hypothetical protein